MRANGYFIFVVLVTMTISLRTHILLPGLYLLFPFLLKANNTYVFNDSLSQIINKKIIPEEYKKPIELALSFFPELKDVPIVFRIKKSYTPLTTKPDFESVFKRKNHRTYIITISDETIDTLSHLLFKNLNFEEQVGIIGHELSHVADFNSKNFFQTIANGIGHLSKKHLDKMEYNTDRICIKHGLGKYLLAYSEHVRNVMHVHTWRGVDFVYHNDQKHERYMNPDTIEKTMHVNSVHKP